jgi:hypothetical protein
MFWAKNSFSDELLFKLRLKRKVGIDYKNWVSVCVCVLKGLDVKAKSLVDLKN